MTSALTTDVSFQATVNGKPLRIDFDYGLTLDDSDPRHYVFTCKTLGKLVATLAIAPDLHPYQASPDLPFCPQDLALKDAKIQRVERTTTDTLSESTSPDGLSTTATVTSTTTTVTVECDQSSVGIAKEIAHYVRPFAAVKAFLPTIHPLLLTPTQRFDVILVKLSDGVSEEAFKANPPSTQYVRRDGIYAGVYEMDVVAAADVPDYYIAPEELSPGTVMLIGKKQTT